MKYVAQYLMNWLLLLDNAAATLLGFDPRLTISAILAIYAREKNCDLCQWLCRQLDRLDKRHCAESIVNWTNYRPWDRSLWKLPE